MPRRLGRAQSVADMCPEAIRSGALSWSVVYCVNGLKVWIYFWEVIELSRVGPTWRQPVTRVTLMSMCWPQFLPVVFCFPARHIEHLGSLTPSIVIFCLPAIQKQVPVLDLTPPNPWAEGNTCTLKFFPSDVCLPELNCAALDVGELISITKGWIFSFIVLWWSQKKMLMHAVRRHLTGKERKAWKAKLPTVSQLMKWLCWAPGSSWSPYAVRAHGERPLLPMKMILNFPHFLLIFFFMAYGKTLYTWVREGNVTKWSQGMSKHLKSGITSQNYCFSYAYIQMTQP